MSSRFQEWQISAQWGARARWISHLIDFFGDPTNQLEPPPQLALPQRPDALVLEFGPRASRPYYTYVTAGLSFVPQLPEGPNPHIELVAYTAAPDPRASLLLWMLAHDIASGTAVEPAYKSWDLWRAETLGFRDFMLAFAREDEALLDFPNVEKRPEDERYLIAATGDPRGKMFLDLLQLVPLTVAQWQLATDRGVATMLEEIGWKGRARTFGWSPDGA